MICPGTTRRFACAAAIAWCAMLSRGAWAQTFTNSGLRWIGIASTCKAPAEWSAERLFRSAQLPTELAAMCLYTWRGNDNPTALQVTLLARISAAAQLTEDVPVLAASGVYTSAELGLLAGLRASLRAQVGDASLLPVMPDRPVARVVVIDSAPEASASHIRIGASRHGDTLAHLIEDLVCKPARTGRVCAAEVTTVLALPWLSRGVLGPDGGYTGSLVDLARAIERATTAWQLDRELSPTTTPKRLILNLSVGWEDSPQLADCTIDGKNDAPPARAVRGILQQATAAGALVIAAAGNDSGGPAPRTGLLCPARYQATPADSDPAISTVLAVSGVDYHDHALATARPLGLTGIAGLGLGGVAWDPADPAPPALTGSSVSAAVASAVAALVLAYQPTRSIYDVEKALYEGGRITGKADQCMIGYGGCDSRRVSVCGALQKAGAPVSCAVPKPRSSSAPSLNAEIAALTAQYAAVPAAASSTIAVTSVARFAEPTIQIDPAIFPQPISGTCPTCVVSAQTVSANGSVLLPALEQPLDDAAIVGQLADGTQLAVTLGALAANTAYKYTLPPGWLVQSAYLTGYDLDSHSFTAQLVVHP